MTGWTLADAPELKRAHAVHDARCAIDALVNGIRLLHDEQQFYRAPRYFELADCWAGYAVECATRYRDARRAVKQIAETLDYFQDFCRELLPSPCEDGETISWGGNLTCAQAAHELMLLDRDDAAGGV